MSWWNTSYSIRKNLKISPDVTIASGSPLFIALDTEKLLPLNKMRSDFEDIEILFLNSDEEWSVLAHDYEFDSENNILTIIFDAVADISTENTSYYIYYCNPTLNNSPEREDYTSSPYSTTASIDTGGIMFSRPTEDWIDGVSSVVNARAAFSFYGRNVKMVFQGSKSAGMVEIRKDSDSPIILDLFKSSDQEVEYAIAFDVVSKHTIRIRVTGDKNPSSDSSEINLKRIEYSKYVSCTLQTEEIYSTSSVVKTIVGS